MIGALLLSSCLSVTNVSERVSEQFLSTEPDRYAPSGIKGCKKYGGGKCIHYATVSLWVNALECAHQSGNTNLERRLIAAFDPFYGAKRDRLRDWRHVDLAIVGAVPLEIAILTGDRKSLELGLAYADRQWEKPDDTQDFAKNWYGPINLAERLDWWQQGYSAQTRLWIDDMYMITCLQTQAYRATKDSKYLDRSAKEMCLYLKRLQRADGLFPHSDKTPYVWGRGAGWMAAAMAMNLKYLPETSPYRAPILTGYRKMMATLLKHQRESGLWGQLVDDSSAWDETSASAMFAYAFMEGANQGLLGNEYRLAAEKAYQALVAKLDAHANLADVCVGTGWQNDHDYYLKRGRSLGDPHGQAPLLWLCRAMMGK